jgi:hypothetical protein
MRLRNLCVASALLALASAQALAQTPPAPAVSVVFAWTVGLDLQANGQLNDAVKALNAYTNGFKGGLCKGRFLEAAFAGPETGTQVLVVDCPNMDAFTRTSQALNADPQFQKLSADVLAKLKAAGGRSVSQSIYEAVM